MVFTTEVDENGNLVEKKLTSEDIKFTLSQFERQFCEIGKSVKRAVDRRVELTGRLEIQKDTLVQLKVEDEENGVPYFPDDPLEMIESDYPFYHDESECAFGDFTVTENPERCVEAMANFVTVIHENLHRFKHLPLGPLYCNMRVASKKWTPIVEYVLRPYLFSFLVDNIVDELVMQELIEQHFPDGQPGTVTKKGVIVPKQFVFAFQNDYSIPSRISSVTGLEMDNMLEVINFDHENWAKFLSKTINIEKILFMDNENIAFLLMSYVKSTPEVCKSVYTLDGFLVLPFDEFKTKRIKFSNVAMYLKNLPNVKIGKVLSKIKRLEDRIENLNNFIKRRRRFQLLYAKRMKNMQEMYELALEIEKFESKENNETKNYSIPMSIVSSRETPSSSNSNKEQENKNDVSAVCMSIDSSSDTDSSSELNFSMLTPIDDSWIREHIGNLDDISTDEMDEEEEGEEAVL